MCQAKEHVAIPRSEKEAGACCLYREGCSMLQLAASLAHVWVALLNVSQDDKLPLPGSWMVAVITLISPCLTLDQGRGCRNRGHWNEMERKQYCFGLHYLFIPL